MERILIFLFVNEKCYGTQLARLTKTPLTPIQKALLRLEKGGIITSYYEGKTRYYQFNPSYPVLTELELLLKKTYTLLPSIEKAHYYVVKEDATLNSLTPRNKIQVYTAFWDKLARVSQLTFHAKSKESQGWNGKGKGEVLVTKENQTLLFHEKGSWYGKQGNEVNFNNVFRWTLDRNLGIISLEHLRFGPDRPVFLVHLTPTSQNTLTSVNTHLCDEDSYFGHIFFDNNSLRLNWRVIGPKKNEEIDYYYF